MALEFKRGHFACIVRIFEVFLAVFLNLLPANQRMFKQEFCAVMQPVAYGLNPWICAVWRQR